MLSSIFCVVFQIYDIIYVIIYPTDNNEPLTELERLGLGRLNLDGLNLEILGLERPNLENRRNLKDAMPNV